MRYEGMSDSDTTSYLNGSLVYLNTITVGDLAYQVYVNLNYVYNSSGNMINPFVESL